MPTKVIQISDCHLRADPSVPYRGQDADANLKKVWEKASAWNPDIVLLTGDLSEDESQAAYERLQAMIQTDAPILALPGNHDDPSLLQEMYPNGPWDGPLAFEAGSWLIVVLDSKLPGRIEGGLSEHSMDRLGEIFAGSSQEHILIALHHQPVLTGARWIDRYPLSDPESFLGLVEAEPRVRAVIWGHIHHHYMEKRGEVLFLGAPSTAANSLPGSYGFDPDPAGPACRTLELDSSGSVGFGQLFGDEA